ncbi:hypothetical protein ACHAXR_004480 [Thalassiosira sp. AJA248-18]
MSSLLALLSVNDRPPWLVGIVPTGGYQYGVELYDGPSSKPHPLPMMSHHGGRDSIVIPDGCCASSNNSTESNCLFDIGIKQKTCTSVQSAFELWSHINGCSSTMLDKDMTNNNRRRLKNVDKVQAPLFTCWEGIDCTEPTTFCLWKNEGHSWGFQFPGIGVSQTWMGEVFNRGERIHGSNLIKEDSMMDDRGDELNASYYASAISYNRNAKGKLIFCAAFALLGLFIALIISRKNCIVFIGKGRKRKTSEDNLPCGSGRDHVALEKLVVP